MQLQDIKSILPNLKLGSNSNIELITRDSKTVKADSIFVAIQGTTWDGHSFIEEALKKNVALVVCEKYEGNDPRVVKVDNSRKTFAELCHIFQKKPSEQLFVVGITGTNGKTTTSLMVESLLNAVDKPCGVIGTIDHHLRGRIWPTSLTSPGADELQLRLREFIQVGAKSAVMEVSSHSLDQHRVDGTQFDAAIFTNLTQDHLDYHKTMQEYFRAKERLFSDLLSNSTKKNPIAIINEDDPYASKINTGSAKRFGFGMKAGDTRFQVTKMDFAGSTLQVQHQGRQFTAHITAVGLHNAYNAIAAALVTQALGMTLEEGLKILSVAPSVSGRLEKIENTKGRHVFVDYAHTPDALERALSFLREIKSQQNLEKQRLIVVFGAGGNRDKTKRPLMGEIASRLADVVYITSDNPRFENAKEIINEIAAAAPGAHKVTLRRQAINKALKASRDNDIVLIAGKGHETYQEIEGVKHEFSDQECVREYFR